MVHKISEGLSGGNNEIDGKGETSHPTLTDINMPVTNKPYSLPREMVPSVMWEVAILTGYREAYQPWIYYLKSLFWIHNETGNIYTHLLSPLFTLAMVYYFSKNIDFYTNQSAHGMLVFIVTAIFMFLLSATAHLLHSKSEMTHYIMYCLDYFGIAQFAYGQGIMLYYCSGNELFYKTVGKSFPIVVALFASNATICKVMARTLYEKHNPKRKLLQVSSGVLCFFVGESPILFRLYSCMMQNNFFCDVKSTFYHSLANVFSLLCVLLFSLHQPEKAYPGKFDIWGHGHQWFHIAVNGGVICISYAVYLDLLTNSRQNLGLAQPNVLSIWLSFFIFIVTNIFMLLLIFSKYKSSVKKNM